MGGSMGKKKSKIIIVGLDNSGKSTMINKLKPKKVITVHLYSQYTSLSLCVMPNKLLLFYQVNDK